MIQTREDWQKVRKLSKWREVVPLWVYAIGAIICTLVILIDNKRSNLWILGLVFFVGKWGLKEGHEEGYVDGWSEAQDYTSDDITIDKLLEVTKSKEDKNK